MKPTSSEAEHRAAVRNALAIGEPPPPLPPELDPAVRDARSPGRTNGQNHTRARPYDRMVVPGDCRRLRCSGAVEAGAGDFFEQELDRCGDWYRDECADEAEYGASEDCCYDGHEAGDRDGADHDLGS
jgi:hypothetical protein